MSAPHTTVVGVDGSGCSNAGRSQPKRLFAEPPTTSHREPPLRGAHELCEDGAGVTTAFMLLNTSGRSYSNAPVVMEGRDGAGCALGLLALLGLGTFLFFALLAALAQ